MATNQEFRSFVLFGTDESVLFIEVSLILRCLYIERVSTVYINIGFTHHRSSDSISG